MIASYSAMTVVRRSLRRSSQVLEGLASREQGRDRLLHKPGETDVFIYSIVFALGSLPLLLSAQEGTLESLRSPVALL